MNFTRWRTAANIQEHLPSLLQTGVSFAVGRGYQRQRVDLA